MKKIISLLLCLSFVFCFAACSAKKGGEATTAANTALKPDIVFQESTYVTLINDVYNNPDNYLGKVIQIDGMFTYEDYTKDGGKVYYYVYRQGPGCCGNDGSMCGFEFTSADGTYPDYEANPGDPSSAHPWIKVTGTLSSYMEGDTGPYYTLKDATYELMSTRGKEVVSL